MRRRRLQLASLGFCAFLATGEIVSAQDASASTPTPARTGESQIIQGIVVTLEDLRLRFAQPRFSRPREASPRRRFNASAPVVLPSAVTAPTGGQSGESAAQQVGIGPDSPQGLADEILGPQITDTAGFVPPDTMGAVGPTQFLFSVNGRFRAFNKNSPHTQIFNIDQVTFWGSTADPAGVSDGHVRYDRTSQRWFITEIDVPSTNNHILLAVSSGPDLSTATWTQYRLPGTGASAATDQNCFADYDTPGIDQNAIYIGANMFGGNVAPCPGFNYKHSNLYVIQKSSALGGTANLTTFYGVVTGTFGVETMQGVDSVESLTTGYAIAVKEDEIPPAHLNVWTINNPGTTIPTLSGPTAVSVAIENGSLGGVLTANNVASADPTRPMDDIDDRLFSAVIRAGHLWTAHNVAVDSTGNSNSGAPTRDAVRWYDVNVPALTLNQSGTVFDSASSGFLSYWMGTVMVSGQGHVAMGLNRANSATVVQAGALGRLSGDPAGTMQAFSLFQNSTAGAYDDSSFNPNPANRWGDFTYTSLDPCDDMTMWTTQEYIAGASAFGLPIDWGVAAEKLAAPPPATPASASPSVIAAGQSGVAVVITGNSSGGSGFYDTPSALTDPCRTRIGAAVSGGVTVNNTSFTDPTHVTVNVSTVGAPAGTANVTITNPDGQMETGNALITVVTPPLVSISFTAAAVPAGGTTALNFTITNPNAAIGLTGVSVSDTLPAGLVVATPNGVTGSCGAGSIIAVAGSSAISLVGGTIAASSMCIFGVNVTGTVTGPKSATTGNVSSNESGAGATSNTATLMVGANRVFVGLNGNNANDCSNSSTPCLSFAGALAEVIPGGEVIVEATGGYGPLNITQAVTINSAAGVVAFSCCTVVVNAPGAAVAVRGLTIDGAGSAGNGIEVVSVGALDVESCAISNFTGAGIHMGAAGTLTIKGTDVAGCNVGLQIDNTAGASVVSLEACHLDGNHTGFVAATTSPGTSATKATSSTANNSTGGGWLCGSGSNGLDVLTLDYCSGSGNSGDGLGNDSANAASAVVYSNCVFANNGGYGVNNASAGVIQSTSNSTITGNAAGQTHGTITSIGGK